MNNNSTAVIQYTVQYIVKAAITDNLQSHHAFALAPLPLFCQLEKASLYLRIKGG
jgi:hypothetical protein